jgi:hypothetical protein
VRKVNCHNCDTIFETTQPFAKYCREPECQKARKRKNKQKYKVRTTENQPAQLNVPKDSATKELNQAAVDAILLMQQKIDYLSEQMGKIQTRLDTLEKKTSRNKTKHFETNNGILNTVKELKRIVLSNSEKVNWASQVIGDFCMERERG